MFSFSGCRIVRSLHGYGDGDDELKWIEREFRLTAKSCIQVSLCMIGVIIGD
jgi:hypothetical protein